MISQEQQSDPAQALGDDLNNQLINDLASSTTLDLPIKIGSTSKSNQTLVHASLEAQLKHLQQLFELNEFDRLVAEWESLSDYYPDLALQLKGQWLAEIKEGFRAKKIERGLLFLDAWSTRFANDFAVEWIKATDQFSRENRIAAVDAIFSLVDQLSGVEHEIYSHQKNIIIKSHLGTLKSKSDWASLIKLLEHLLWYQPSNDLYTLEIAEAYFQLGQYQQSRFRLELLIGHAYYGKRAQILLDEINRLSLVKAVFPLIKQSAHYLIEGQLNSFKITLLIDTGASISVLSEWFFKQKKSQLNPEFVRHAVIDTAGGIVEAPIYRFKSFAIGEYRVRDIEFVVMALSQNNGASQGLLGMNFLKYFAFNLDQDKQHLILQPRD